MMMGARFNIIEVLILAVDDPDGGDRLRDGGVEDEDEVDGLASVASLRTEVCSRCTIRTCQ